MGRQYRRQWLRRPGGRPKRRFIHVELDGSRKEDVEASGRWRQLIGCDEPWREKPKEEED